MNILGKPIFLILLAALVLRLWGIGYGFPFFLVNDEPALVLGALKMLELRTLVPAWHEGEFRKVLNYPPLTSYFYLVTLAPVLAVHYALSGFPPLMEYMDAFTLDPSFLWIAARVINAILGVAVVYITYRLARTVTGSERGALLAAMFLAVSFYEVQLSQVVRHWMPASLLLVLAWLAAEGVRAKGERRFYLIAGLMTGLGMGVNTSSAIGLLPALWYHFGARGRSMAAKMRSLRLWQMIALAVVLGATFILLYPYGFTRGEGASSVGSDIGRRFSSLASRFMAIPEWANFLFGYAKLLLWYEATLVAGALIGAWALLRRNASFVLLAIVFCLVYLSLLYFFFNAIPRALIFILPPLAVLAGYGVDELVATFENRLRPTRLAALAIFGLPFLIFFAYPLVIDLRYDYLLSQSDTRLVAKRWIESNIPPGTKVLADLPYLRLINTKEGIRELAAIDPTALRAQDRVLLRRDEASYPKPAYHLLNLHFVAPEAPERRLSLGDVQQRGFRYLMVEYEYMNGADLDPHLSPLIEAARLVNRFMPFRVGGGLERALDISGEIATIHPMELFSLERFGQIVEIYAIPER